MVHHPYKALLALSSTCAPVAEDIFVQCIRHSALPEYVAFYEIPVEKRDLPCPKRIGVTLHHSKLKPPMTPPAA